jgi:uncharacterized membrane protein SpoIIM required for sporulation
MKVSELLKQRQTHWRELEQMCAHMENRRKSKMAAHDVAKFAAMYRSVCADLALADSYQLPPRTIQYLHQLVGRAHNQLYRSRSFDVGSWVETLFRDVPRRIFHDRCVQVAFCLFWGVFVAAAALAGDEEGWPTFAESMVTEPMLEHLEDNFANPIQGRDGIVNPQMAGFYIWHNTGIGLQCFAGGLLVLPGLLVTIFNAAHLGAIFGYMSRPGIEAGANFFHFVTAHGPCELTAIVLSAGAGLRLGYSWVFTDGLSRVASLRKAAQQTMPVMGAAMVLFFLAAMIEAFLSPSGLPYAIKAVVAIVSSGVITAYFIVLGYPEESTT